MGTSARTTIDFNYKWHQSQLIECRNETELDSNDEETRTRWRCFYVDKLSLPNFLLFYNKIEFNECVDQIRLGRLIE